MLLAAAAIYKGKRLLALVGVFVPLVALTAAVRLAKPRSRWARRFYDDDKKRKAQARFASERDRAPRGSRPRGHVDPSTLSACRARFSQQRRLPANVRRRRQAPRHPPPRGAGR